MFDIKIAIIWRKHCFENVLGCKSWQSDHVCVGVNKLRYNIIVVKYKLILHL